MRPIAIIAPGIFLSHPPITRTPSMLWPCATVSIESAMTSRDTSENFIPSVPIEMPSEIVMVPNVCGMAPAFFAADSARRVRSLSPRLHGVMVL